MGSKNSKAASEEACFQVEIPLGIQEAEEAVRAVLAEHQFGVLTEIDVSGVLKQKINVDREPLRILGACNPTFANQALQESTDSAALLMPCNVVLRAVGEGATVVMTARPTAVLHPIVQGGKNDKLAALAREGDTLMGRVVDQLRDTYVTPPKEEQEKGQEQEASASASGAAAPAEQEQEEAQQQEQQQAPPPAPVAEAEAEAAAAPPAPEAEKVEEKKEEEGEKKVEEEGEKKVEEEGEKKVEEEKQEEKAEEKKE